MASNLVVDKDILGWATSHEEELLKHYKSVLKVGIDADLPQRSFDENVAVFCKNRDCDLLTGDSRAHVHFFEAGMRSLQITKFAWWKEGDRPIYLIRIID